MLLWKEIKKTVLSITFAVFIIFLLAFAISQEVLNFSNEIITVPQQGEDYGTQQKEEPELIMPAAFSSLYKEFTANEYIAYPIGFYKNVKLNDTDQEKMAEIISTLSGVPVDDLLNKSNIKVNLSADISYKKFKECMKQADNLIGGGSNYSENSLLNFSCVNLIASTDKFTGAYARLFCDYIGIILSILPVFIAVAVCLKDRRAKMNDLIYARKISSFKLILSRYFAIIIAVMLPTVILAYISNSTIWGQYSGMNLDYFAPLKYAIGWLMPSAMIAVAIGIFFTELTETPIAIAIQGLWWFIDLNAGVSRMGGVHTLFELTPRHNVLGNTQIFLDEFNTLVANRLVMSGAALLFVIATVIIYEQKRRGRFSGYGKIKIHITSLANRKGKSAA